MSTTHENVVRLLRAVGMDDYGDGYIVTDVIRGYAEPGYSTDPESVVVLGDWNPVHVAGVTGRPGNDEGLPSRYESQDKRVTLPARLFDALERVGANCEWLDEWSQCQECYRAVRTTENSYHWKPSFAWMEDSGPVCHDCLLTYGADALDEYMNDASKCITWCEPSHVESFGFVKWAPGDEQTYESGWHPGQTDKPEPIMEAIHEQHPEADVVFFLDESSQFYIKFSAYVRFASDEQDA